MGHPIASRAVSPHPRGSSAVLSSNIFSCFSIKPQGVPRRPTTSDSTLGNFVGNFGLFSTGTRALPSRVRVAPHGAVPRHNERHAADQHTGPAGSANDKDYKLPDERGLLLDGAALAPNGGGSATKFKARKTCVSPGVYPDVSLSMARARRDLARPPDRRRHGSSAEHGAGRRPRAAFRRWTRSWRVQFADHPLAHDEFLDSCP